MEKLITTSKPLLAKSADGFSLLEVLISVFILAIGLLGLAALQLNALGYSNDGQSRSIVLHQMSEIADRMRANTAGASAGAYNGLSVTSATPNCNVSGGCTTAQIAQRDFNLWNADNAAWLTAGAGTITQINANTFDITIRWDSHKTGATGTGCSGNFDTDLACVTMRVNI